MFTNEIVSLLSSRFGSSVSSDQLIKVAKELGLSSNDLLNSAKRGALPRKSSRSFFTTLPSIPASVESDSTVNMATVIEMKQPSSNSFDRKVMTASKIEVPSVNSEFVPFGIFKDLVDVLDSGVFAPVMITGDSGNGKTFSVQQACAKLKRKFVSISIDEETTEDDLFGKYELIDGNTVYFSGAFEQAMLEGAVVLLDEMDRGRCGNMITLNMALDGYDVFNKKTGRTISPAPGFMVVATCNTKGQGDTSDSGRFVAANILDESTLERFPITLEQEYPSVSIETKMLAKVCDDEMFVEALVKWANVTRESYRAGAVENMITTRRLKFIAGENYKIFKNPKKAVERGIARFPEILRKSFVELFDSISTVPTTVVSDEESKPVEASSQFDTDIPF